MLDQTNVEQINHTKISSLSLLAVLTLTCQGCSHSAWYEGFRQGRTNECCKLPDTDKEQCLKEIEVSYDTYRKERQKTID